MLNFAMANLNYYWVNFVQTSYIFWSTYSLEPTEFVWLSDMFYMLFATFEYFAYFLRYLLSVTRFYAVLAILLGTTYV